MTLALLLLMLSGDLVAAEQALADGDPARAIELLGDLAAAEDADVRALLVLGNAYNAQREYEAAVEPLLRAIEKSPKDKSVARAAAWACWGASRSGGSFARAYLEDGLRYARLAGDARMVAAILYDLGNYAEALVSYRALPDDAKTRLDDRTRIAHCLAALGKADEARVAYGIVLDEAIRQGDLAGAFRNAFRAKRTGQLLAWLDKRIEADPENVELRLHRGYAREGLGMWRETAEDLRVALRLAPRHADARRRLARALVYYGTREQQPEAVVEAEQHARAALKQDSADTMARDTMRWIAGWAWANRDVEKSFALLTLLHDLDPEARDTALNFCAMARRLGHYKQAERAFLVLLEVDDEDNDVINDFAILKDGMGEEAEAIRLWERALAIAPADLNALENLFTKAWENGDAAGSRKYLALGLVAVSKIDNPGLLGRWIWFRDRLRWAPAGHGVER